MSVFTRPTVRHDPPDGESSPVEAKLMPGGQIRLKTDPDASPNGATWFTPAELREFVTDLLALADASEKIHA